MQLAADPVTYTAPRDGCHECGTYISGSQGICKRCGQVRTCAKCALLPHVQQRHQVTCFPVQFSITAPSGVVENVVANVGLGGLGAVHQYVSMRAFLDPQTHEQVEAQFREWEPLSPRLHVIALLAGVIYNDFPGKNDADTDQSYVKTYLVPIEPSNAYYITDRRFLWQPSADARWANAAVYKGVPASLMALAGVKATTMRDAQAMLNRRVQKDHVNYHFLRAEADETMREAQKRAVATAEQWYRRAVEWRSLFLFGHIWHQMQDSFSPAHTRRTLARTDEHPYGTVDEIYYFGDQSESWHSRHESWDAVRSAGSEGARRVEAAVPALRDALAMFIRDVNAAPPLPLGWDWARMDKALTGQREYAEGRACIFGKWLAEKAYALGKPSML